MRPVSVRRGSRSWSIYDQPGKALESANERCQTAAGYEPVGIPSLAGQNMTVFIRHDVGIGRESPSIVARQPERFAAIKIVFEEVQAGDRRWIHIEVNNAADFVPVTGLDDAGKHGLADP